MFKCACCGILRISELVFQIVNKQQQQLNEKQSNKVNNEKENLLQYVVLL